MRRLTAAEAAYIKWVNKVNHIMPSYKEVWTEAWQQAWKAAKKDHMQRYFRRPVETPGNKT